MTQLFFMSEKCPNLKRSHYTTVTVRRVCWPDAKAAAVEVGEDMTTFASTALALRSVPILLRRDRRRARELARAPGGAALPAVVSSKALS